MSEVEELSKAYSGKGFGRRLGFGSKPVVLVIDFMKVFTDKKTPLGANYAYQLQQTNRILAEARKVGVSITGGCGQMTAVHRVQGDCNLVTSNTEVQDEII